MSPPPSIPLARIGTILDGPRAPGAAGLLPTVWAATSDLTLVVVPGGLPNS